MFRLEMQLTVIEAARVLKVTEDMIYQWIRNDSLPVTRVGGRFRVNRFKLIDWAHKKGLAVAVEGDPGLPILEGALARGEVLNDVKAKNLLEAVSLLIEKLPAMPDMSSPDLAQYLSMRSNYGFSAGTSGVAVPETRSPVVLPLADPLLYIAYLSTPVSVTGHPCSILFLCAVPSAVMHFNLMTRILCALADAEFMDLLNSRAAKEALLSRLSEIGNPEAVSAASMVTLVYED